MSAAHPALALLALLAIAPATAAAQEQPSPDLDVDAVMPWRDTCAYTPISVSLRAKRGPRVVELKASTPLGHEAVAQVRVPDGASVHTTLLLPPGAGHVPAPRLTWKSDRGSEGEALVTTFDVVPVLFVDPESRLALAAPTEATPAATPPHAQLACNLWLALDELKADHLGVEWLPDRWQAYPDWLTVVLSPAGDRALRPAQREALTRWVRGGGDLRLADPAAQPGWPAQVSAARIEGAATDPRFVALEGRLAELRAQAAMQPVRITVPGTEEVPAAAFAGLALLFALLAGPLNLWWVRRRGARLLFLFTTPALSALTCALLLGANLASEGLGTSRAAVQVTLLDDAAQQAVVWSAVTYYAGVAPGRLALDPEDQVRGADPDENARDQRDLHLDWRRGQELRGGFIPARRNRQVIYTSHRPERRRLQFREDADPVEVVNGLGVPLERVCRRSEDGREACTSGPLPEGAVARLDIVQEPSGEPALLQRVHAAARTAWQREQQRRGFYWAETAAPFLPLPGPAAEDLAPHRGLILGASSANSEAAR